MQETLTQVVSGLAVAAIIAGWVAIGRWYKRIRAILAGLEGVKYMQLT
jgi:hypothetical protein